MNSSDNQGTMHGPHETVALRRRLLIALFAVALIHVIGAAGFYLLGAGRWKLADCAYMTLISITTVGYGEILDGLDHVRYARLFTAGLIISGAVTAVYVVSVLTTVLVEGEFLHLRRRHKMRARIDRTSDHVIVCGAGRTGTHIASELAASLWRFVIVDLNEAKIERCCRAIGAEADYIVGDATDDAVLMAAGVERARGLMAALSADKDNLYVVVTARGLNPNVRIVSKASDPRAVPKLEAAGADRVVSVNRIGGHRMASEMIRPHVVEFIETMIRDKDKNLRFEEFTVPAGSPLAGQALAQAAIRKVGKLLVVAAGDSKTGQYTYSPGPEFLLQEGMTLILLGETRSVERFRKSSLFESS